MIDVPEWIILLLCTLCVCVRLDGMQGQSIVMDVLSLDH